MLVLGNFGHNLFRFSWLWYGAFLVLIEQMLRERAEAELVDVAPADAPGDHVFMEESPWTFTPG